MIGVYDSYNKKPRVQVIKGDFIDRLHGRKSISLLFTILIMIVFKQAIYSNVICWFPTALSPQQNDYVNLFCWTNSNYIVPDNYESDNYDTYYHSGEKIPYYQFMIFILIGQIFMFYIPSFIWDLMSSNSYGYMNKLLDISSASFKNTNTDEFLKYFKPLRNKKKKKVTKSDLEVIESNDSLIAKSKQKQIDSGNTDDENLMSSDNCKIRIRKSGQKEFLDSQTIRQKMISQLNPLNGVNGLAKKYILLKVLNLGNSIGQIFLLNVIFSGKFLDYGWKYAKKLWHAQNPLFMTKEFPVFTLCDFSIHQPNRKLHDNTIQCILTMNVLYEKFYIIIWFWLIILSIVTFLNLISWIYEILFSAKAQFLHKYLKIQFKMTSGMLESSNGHKKETDEDNKILIPSESKIEEYDVENFQKRYLGTNGLVMLLIIKSVAGDLAFIKILGVLYHDFTEEIKTIEIESSQE